MRYTMAITLFLICLSAQAKEQPLIQCPPANNLHIIEISPLTGWGKFFVRGKVNVTNSKSRDFFISGRTNATKASTFIGASYIPVDNDFICLYQGITATGKTETIILGLNNVQRLLHECQFNQGDHYECSGHSVERCQLTCH